MRNLRDLGERCDRAKAERDQWREKGQAARSEPAARTWTIYVCNCGLRRTAHPFTHTICSRCGTTAFDGVEVVPVSERDQWREKGQELRDAVEDYLEDYFNVHGDATRLNHALEDFDALKGGTDG